MPTGIIILGSPGAGKTTLGQQTAAALDFRFIDIDEYIWRMDTPRPFTVMYSRAEKIDRLMDAIHPTAHFVMAGSMYSIHEHFDSFFELAVFLHADAKLRAARVHARVHARELERFGSRVLAGGDLYEDHQHFLTEVEGYDDGIGGATLAQHQAWIASLRCNVIRLDGADALEKNVQAIISAYENR